MRGQLPGPGKTTKTLNTGVTAVAPSTSNALGYKVYVSLANAPSTLYLQPAPPTGEPFDTFYQVSSINTGLGTAPASNTATVTPPSTAPTLNSVGGSGSTLTGGTYYVAYTYVTTGGETTTSPVLAVTIASGQVFNLGPFQNPNETAITVELIVPNLEDWHVTRYAIYVSSSTNIPTCNVYVDTQAITSLLDTTPLGAQNSANADIGLRPGQSLICAWIGVDLGARVTFSVFGEKIS